MEENWTREFDEMASALPFVKSEDIPDIDLYMDQVLTFLERKLAPISGEPSDKPVTKTMINNYVKANVLPAPEKKKYTKEHMIYLLLLYCLKSLYSIDDSGKLLAMVRELTEETKTPEKGKIPEDGKKEEGAKQPPLLSLPEIFDLLNEDLKEQVESTVKSAEEAFEKASASFRDLDCTKEQREELQTFEALMRLSIDAYLKKRFVEQLLTKEK